MNFLKTVQNNRYIFDKDTKLIDDETQFYYIDSIMGTLKYLKSMGELNLDIYQQNQNQFRY